LRGTRYSFFAEGVGRVAEVETFHLTVFWLYNIHGQSARVLNSYTEDRALGRDSLT
jgi:hypothetical protein